MAQRGDSAADVAARIGLPPNELARFNGMEPSDNLREGEVLALPRRVAEPTLLPGSVNMRTITRLLRTDYFNWQTLSLM